MAKTILGGGDEYGMQLLAGFAGNEDPGGSQAARGVGALATLAVAGIARVALNIIATGSASLRPGDIVGIGGGGRGEGTGGGAA